MIYHSNTETEIKLDIASGKLNKYEEAFLDYVGDSLGTQHFLRVYQYLDFDDLPLRGNGISFRKSERKPSYCLKYPVGRDREAWIRREVFCKDSEMELSIMSPVHRRVPVLSRMIALLDDAGFNWQDRLQTFSPRLRVECHRRFHKVPRKSTGETILGVCFDSVVARPCGAAGEECRWTEVEIELNSQAPEGLPLALDVCARLQEEGAILSSEGKYQKASRLLHLT